MKRIYDFSRKPAKRNYTIADLQDLKITGQKLSMANPLNASEIRACRDAGIDLFVCGMDQIDDVRFNCTNSFLPCRLKVGTVWLK
jgi:3-methyl-2-oxobutanoate hydroxymethyltransferase